MGILHLLFVPMRWWGHCNFCIYTLFLFWNWIIGLHGVYCIISHILCIRPMVLYQKHVLMSSIPLECVASLIQSPLFLSLAFWISPVETLLAGHLLKNLKLNKLETKTWQPLSVNNFILICFTNYIHVMSVLYVIGLG